MGANMSTKKRPKGRPSNLTKEHIKTAEYYATGGFAECGDKVPTVAGLACLLGTSSRQVHRWAEASPNLRHTLDKIKTNQEKLLVNGGLGGDLNATITKLMLANHGYSDRVDNNHTSSDGSMTPITKIELIAKQ